MTENTQFSNGKVTVAQYRPVEIPQTQAAGTGLESIMLRIETQGAESLAESDQRQRELHINQELFSCASCGAGSKGHAGRADANADLRLFSCLHSVCRRCLASSCIRDDGTAVCPSCLEPTQLPEIGWVEALPRNYWSQARGEANAEHTEPAELECGECAEGEAVESIAGACLDCSELLCSVHWLAHQKGRRTKGHRMTTDVGAVLRTPSGITLFARPSASRVPCIQTMMSLVSATAASRWSAKFALNGVIAAIRLIVIFSPRFFLQRKELRRRSWRRRRAEFRNVKRLSPNSTPALMLSIKQLQRRRKKSPRALNASSRLFEGRSSAPFFVQMRQDGHSRRRWSRDLGRRNLPRVSFSERDFSPSVTQRRNQQRTVPPRLRHAPRKCGTSQQ